MKVTLSAAMRARDVSRPHADHEEAAEEADARAEEADARAAAPRPAGPALRFRTAAGRSGADQPTAGDRAREDIGERPAAIPKSAGGRPRRKRR